MKYKKACDPLDFLTTPHPTSYIFGIHGNDVVHDIFCAKLPYLPPAVCPGPGVKVEPVCGTNWQTYENL